MPAAAAARAQRAPSAGPQRAQPTRSGPAARPQPKPGAPRASPTGLPRYLQGGPAGQPLPRATQRDMEQRFNAPLDGVRVHSGPAAAASAASLGARAYASGSQLVFGAGAYAPETPSGRGLLAHELTHVLQQRRAGTAGAEPQRSVADGGARRVGAGGDAAEREAEANALKVKTLPAQPLQASATPAAPVQRSVLDTLGDAADAVGDAAGAVGGAISDAGSAAADLAQEGVDRVVELASDAAMALLERVAPSLVPIVEMGLWEWLKQQMAEAFDGVIGLLSRLDPSGTLSGLVEGFAALAVRASDIVAALASGDCQPLMDALGELKTFVTEVAGAAWDRVTEFFAPVGDFFSELWSGYALPAAQWLSEGAGALWQRLRQFGQDIWDWTEPVRDAVGGAWDWVKEQLFGADEGGSGNSSGGIIGWISDKAAAAWDWVKEATAPVWRPIERARDRVLEWLPPEFLRGLGAQAQQLSTQLQAADTALNDGGDEEGDGTAVAQNREALAAVLPGVRQLIGGVRRALVAAGGWLSAKVGALAEGVGSLMGALRSAPLLSLLADALDWLDSAAQRLLAWVSDGVGALFDLVVGALDGLTPFIEAAAGVVQRLIGVVGNLMRLPMLVASTVWHAIPCCIREPIKNFVVHQILGRIPVFGQFFTDPTLWPRVQATAMRILRRVFVDGDLAGAAWDFFRSVLGVLGVPARLVVQILAKATSAIGQILTHPIDFIVNLLSAVKTGFGRFFDNILTHLMSGVSGWLFHHVREAGIAPPRDFSLRSILSFALDVLGITAARLWRKLEDRLDARTVQRLRSMLNMANGVWRFVVILVEQGPAGLWEELQSQLGNLWDTLVNGVIGWINQRVIERATRWLMSLLDVSGVMPVINAMIAVYNAIESFMQYLRQMLEIASRVLDGVLGIASGAIDAAAGFLERALVDSLPVAIGFLANQFGFGRIGERLREILESVQGAIDRALDWLVDRAIRLGQSLIDMARRGAAAVGRAVRNLREWWSNRFGFTTRDGQSHELYFRGQGANAELTIASEPKSFSAFLDEQAAGADAARRERVNAARVLYRQLLESMRQAGTDAGGAAAAPSEEAAARVVALTEQLADAARELMGGDAAGVSSAPEFGELEGGMGRSVRVLTLNASHPPGNQPSVAGGLWEVLQRRRHGGSTYYVMGHLLNHHLGGTGASWANLTPMTRSVNTSFSSRFEEKVKQRVHDHAVPVQFEVSLNFGRGANPALQQRLRASGDAEDALTADIIAAEQHVPTQLQASAVDKAAGSSGAGSPVPAFSIGQTVAQNPDDYQLSDGTRRIEYVSEMSKQRVAEVCDVPVPPGAGFPGQSAWRTQAAVLAATRSARAWPDIVAASGSRLRLYRV